MTSAHLIQWAILLGESLLAAGILLALFRLRHRVSLALLCVGLGVLQPIQVQLAGSVFAPIGGGLLVSPGSVVLFTAGLFALLLVYLCEDAIEVRKVVYGLVAGNIGASVLYIVFGLHLQVESTVNPLGLPSELYLQGARQLLTGTLVLVADVLLVIPGYEWIRRYVPGSLFLRTLLTMVVILAFDSIAFSLGAFLGRADLGTLMLSALVGKSVVAVLFSAALTLYVRRYEPLGKHPATRRPVRDVFAALTYKERFERSQLESESALRRADSRRKALLAAMRDCAIVVSEEGRVVDTNQVCARTFGLAADAWEGMALGEVLPGLDHRALDETCHEIEALRANGSSFPAEVSAVTATGAASDWTVVCVSDISDKKRLQRELVHAGKLSSIGHLAGGVAHDFNNLLTVILGTAESLRTQVSGPAQADLNAIEEAAERGARLTNQLLLFARKNELTVRAIDVSETLRQMEGLLRRMLGEDIELELRTHGSAVADLSPEMLDQILLNLVANARDAMPDGGQLTLETRATPRIAQMMAEGDACVVLRVTDTGSGMSSELIGSIFDPFFTTKEIGVGTGMGLSMCWSAVRQIGGHIEVTSELGRGSTFSVFLPSSTTHASEDSALQRNGSTVLLVENDQRVARVVKRALTLRGHRVVTAFDAEEAVNLAGELGSGLDLLVTDYLLPRMRGDELAVRLRDHQPRLPVVLVTGFGSDSSIDVGHRARIVRKPFTNAKLIEAVDGLLGDD